MGLVNQILPPWELVGKVSLTSISKILTSVLEVTTFHGSPDLATVTSSSDFNDHYLPATMFDDREDTYWVSRVNRANWISIHFTKIVLIKQIRLTRRPETRFRPRYRNMEVMAKLGGET